MTADATPRPDYVKKLKTFEVMAFGASIDKDPQRGPYAIEAVKAWYEAAHGKDVVEKDHYLQAGFRQAEAGYKAGRGFTQPDLLKTMMEFAKTHQDMLFEEANLGEVLTYLSDGQTIAPKLKALLEKYKDKTHASLADDNPDKEKIQIIILAYRAGKMDRLVPKFGDRTRSGLEKALMED
jgi:hypothetical protein